MKTVIIEDEYRAADRLERLLKKHDPKIEVEEKLDSVEYALDWLQNNPHPELMFVDIQLADGLSFEIFDKVEVKSFIIFTTAYDEYAIRAFDLNSIDYLLKPVDEKKLAKSLEKFKNFTSPLSNVDAELLKQLLGSGEKSYKKRFVVNVGNKIRTINTNDIAWFVFEERTTFLVTKENKYYPIDFSLDKLELMVSPEDYFRISRQYLVSFDAITNISVLSRSRIKLQLKPEAKEEVVVSTTKSSKFREWLDK
jgi:DNA-binding LytR/AlgR family response regulator